MQILKLLFCAALLVPCAARAEGAMPAEARTESSASQQEFNVTEAAEIWSQWRQHHEFTQEEYTHIMDMCETGFNYLISRIQQIKAQYPDVTRRQNALRDLDHGYPGDVETFCRSFSTRMTNCALNRKFDLANRDRLQLLDIKKQEYKAEVESIAHPQQ